MFKTTIALVFLLFYLNSTNAQQFNFEIGKVISSFDYKNSEGEKLSNLLGTTDNHLAIGFKNPLRSSNFYFLSSVFYNKYGAKGSDESVGNYYDWIVNYLGLKIGAGYEFLKTSSQINFKNTNSEEAFTFYVQVEGGSEFLVQGTQTINNAVYSLKGVEQFDKPLIFALGSLGINYYATKSLSVFFQYTGGKSFSLFKSGDDKEVLNFITHTFSLGVGINLPAFKR